jgi:mannose-1-phosphate guanylyltransferase
MIAEKIAAYSLLPFSICEASFWIHIDRTSTVRSPGDSRMRLVSTTHRSGAVVPHSFAPQSDETGYAAVILAGGDGVRLSSFTQKVFGYHLPKQFCPLFEGETMLERTMRRVSLVVHPARTVTVLNRLHERFYSPILRGVASARLLVQPENRGTAPAILGALLQLAEKGHTGPVAIFPSDHYVSDDSVFMRHVTAAFHAVELAPRLAILLGITPDGPDTEYGWIEPGALVAAKHPVLEQVSQIRRFCEKPSPEVARDLYGRNCLWNSFILVGNVLNLLSLTAGALPEIYAEFTKNESFTDAGSDRETLGRIFRDLPSADFSRSVLAEFPAEFCVMPVRGVGWSDLGDARRLLAAISSSNALISGGILDIPESQSFAIPDHQRQTSRHKASEGRQ